MCPNEPRGSILALGLALLLASLVAGCGPSGSSGPGSGEPGVPAEATEAAQTLIELQTTRETRPAEGFYPTPMYGADRS